ncbi:glycosyl hydrolase [Limisphaera sp. VF-2]|uniref:glycosyl hydrolase n=1 Tax=Limisphaera sp. VF-2 TaxID=3400418 RepID=UPI00175C1C9A
MKPRKIAPRTCPPAGSWRPLLWLSLLLLPWAHAQTNVWPPITRQARPWTYWWWMGSAVDRTNLVRELTRYREAGLGGVHIIPIYGAKGWEDRYVPYLSPAWLDLLDTTVREAERLDLGVDMTTGTGWCFGGPRVTDREANALVEAREFTVAAGETWSATFEVGSLQALMAFGPADQRMDLLPHLREDGSVTWQPRDGPWRVIGVSQRPSGQRVKRAAPGGEGHMLNLFEPLAMTNYLRWFDEAFSGYSGARPRAQYHDSYEYRCDWSPSLFVEFERRRGYRLQDHLDAFFGREPTDRAARIKCDYRETLSDLMAEVTLPLWTAWAHRHGWLTRNEAHGSPGNWLDLYAAADIPETEMFHRDRNRLLCKFASSAAHLTGRPLVSSETGTWLAEHFTETLADLKGLLDDFFLSGVNHVFYHGTCYSPDEVPWPGWLFYASFQMNPRNPVWRDAPILNRYVARCQAVLQSGRPDNDLLLYWPIHDLWHNPTGTARNLTIHARDWFESQPVGEVAAELWAWGYAFDYVSDRFLARAHAEQGRVHLPGGAYRGVVVPACQRMPVPTLRKLLELAEAGAPVFFARGLPEDVPGWHQLEARRKELAALLERAQALRTRAGVRLYVGDLLRALSIAGIEREPMFDFDGLMCIRRALPNGGYYYFVANRAATEAFEGWVTLARPARAVRILDPMTGRYGRPPTRVTAEGGAAVYLQLWPGASLILQTGNQPFEDPPWTWWTAAGPSFPLEGPWEVEFIAGGPTLPARYTAERAGSWTEGGDPERERFAGTARYTLRFDAPPAVATVWRLDLGRVAQSARVRLNGRDVGTCLMPPWRLEVRDLQPRNNILEIEVTSTAANRIRDLDRRGVAWKTFHDINFVNINYRPFNAADWPVRECGLLGPVTLTPLEPIALRE